VAPKMKVQMFFCFCLEVIF